MKELVKVWSWNYCAMHVDNQDIFIGISKNANKKWNQSNT